MLIAPDRVYPPITVLEWILGADIDISWKSVHPICAPFHTSPIYAFTQNQPDAYICVTHACIWLGRDYYFLCESQQRTDGDENQDENSKLLKIPKLKSWLAVEKVLDTFTDLHTAMYMLQSCYVWILVQIAWSTQRGCHTGTLHLLSSFIYSSVSRLSSFKHPRALLAHLTSPHHLLSIVLSLSLSLSTFLPPRPALSVDLSMPSINFSVCYSAVRAVKPWVQNEWPSPQRHRYR